MAISTYDELKAAVATWLNRTDLTDQIPDFITLAESGLNRRLRLRLMETEASLTIASGRSVALPAGYVEPVGLWAVEDYGRREVRFLSPVQMEVQTESGTPYFWTVTGENIEVERPVDVSTSFVFRYLATLTLSDAAPTNWLLTNHPDALLFGALVEAGPYLRDPDLLNLWTGRLNQAVAEINDKEGRTRAQTTLSTDLPRDFRSGRWADSYL